MENTFSLSTYLELIGFPIFIIEGVLGVTTKGTHRGHHAHQAWLPHHLLWLGHGSSSGETAGAMDAHLATLLEVSQHGELCLFVFFQ